MKFDIIGDIHGCYDEFLHLDRKTGYSMETGIPVHPDGRQLVFVGDAMDRGPHSIKMLNLLFNYARCEYTLFIPREIIAINFIDLPKGIMFN